MGDDLRQDLLVLELFHHMDLLWLSDGIDFSMTHFRVLPTAYRQGEYIYCPPFLFSPSLLHTLLSRGTQITLVFSFDPKSISFITFSTLGLVELVKDCQTLRQIQAQLGALTGQFATSSIRQWLRNHNPTDEFYQKVPILFLSFHAFLTIRSSLICN